MILLIAISTLFALIYYLLMVKYAALWKSIPSPQDAYVGNVNVLIPFRNEEGNLPELIAAFNQLNYPAERLKLIFINDHSTDKSVDIIKSGSLKYSFQILSLTETEGKKEAIKLAWKYCDAEVIVHTDADCVPPANWLNSLLSAFADTNIKFASAPVDYFTSNSFWSRLLRMDFISLIGIGAAHIAWGHPLICNGANLAYRKEVLGLIHMNESKTSGDDVFLMLSIAEVHPKALCFVKHKEAIVLSRGPGSLKAFIHQRLRWAGKNTSYPSRFNTLLLGFSWLFNVLILTSLLSLSKVGLLLFLLLICFKILAEAKFYDSISSFFQLSNWSFTLMKGQLLHIIYMALLPPLSALFKYEWKGRKKKK